MKNLFLIPATVFVGLALASCQKSDYNFRHKEDSGTPREASASLKAITGRTIYTPDEFIDKLSKSTYASWIGMEDLLKPTLEGFVALRSSYLRSLFINETKDIRPANWQIEQINFDYRTVDVRGDSVTMSGIICYPNNSRGVPGHTLSTVSLVCHTYYNFNTDCPSFKGDITMGRALLNSLVVLPDMQGYGSAKNLGDAMIMSRSCARQVVDCERVALEIIRKEGLKLAEDYRTDVMGYSLGGGVMMGVARWMEEGLTEKDKELFRYNGTFCGGGVFNAFDLTTELVRNATGEMSSFCTMPPMMLYYAKGWDLNGYQPEDFLTPQYTATIETIEGRPVSPSNYLMWRFDETEETSTRINNVMSFFATPEAMKVFPDDMNSENLILDPSKPKTRIFKEICDREIPYTDWTPTHRITIMHPENDNFMPYFMAKDAYEALKYKNNGGNNVNLIAFTVPDVIARQIPPHYVGTAIAQLRMLVNEDPSLAEDGGILENILKRLLN